MKQIYQALVVVALLVTTAPAGALGLGKLEQDSSLNERFEGRIPLLSGTAEELSTLKIGLADREAFRRAGINYAPNLNDLKFKLVEPQTGGDYILVTSSQPIREPFLNFLLELSWASGRIYREYTVLLDPPLYDPNQGRVAREPGTTASPAAESAPAESSKYSHTVIYPEEQPADTARYTPSYSSGDYGPVQSGETLWSIANTMRPAAVTTHQMMLALLRANPEAFIDNNINALKRGAILRMPADEHMNAMSPAEALAQVKQQHSLWEDARQSVAASAAPRADTAATAEDEVPATADETTAADTAEDEAADSRLELLAATDGTSEQQAGTTTGGDSDLSRQMALANEKLESLGQENAELKDRLAENEALIEDLKRLIALKDDELAQLQSRVAGESAGVETGAPATAATQVADGVNYPNGDPSRFLKETPPVGEELLPGPVPPAPEISHTVNHPEPAAAMPTEATETAPAQADESGPEAEPEKPVSAEPAAKTAAREPASGGLVDTLMGLVATARDFIMNNLIMAGGALLVLILLVAGAGFLRRQREASAEKEIDEMMAGGEFPDFAVESDPDQTSFENDAESATEINAVGSSAVAEEEDAPTEIGAMAGPAEESDDADDLFVVPEGEAEPVITADEEDDPLAEVNVLMAYEHFDQAESFVRNKLKSEPDNVEFHAKLLEIFYSAGNKKKYEEAASDLRDLTGARGEHWDMAVAMWQELSPNRPLFEGSDEEEPAESTTAGGGAGIVDITGDTAGGADKAEGTGGGIDFDLGDSTGAGSEASDDGGMLDLTASSEEEDDSGMLDLTAASSSEGSFDETQSLSAPEETEDNSLDFSLDGAGGGDLLDVTQSGELDAGGDLLDVTSVGQSEEDNGLDFLDIETTGESGAEQDAGEDNSLEFDGGLDLDPEAKTAGSTAAESEADDSLLEFDSGSSEAGVDLEIEDDSADSGDLDEIGEELDRLEQTLGTLTRQNATKSFGTNTSDALDGIDSALEEINDESGSAADDENELDISLEGLSLEENDDAGSEDLSEANLSEFSIEFDTNEDSGMAAAEEDDLSAELADLNLDLDEDDGGTAAELADDDISAELSKLSEQLDSDDLDLGDDELSMNFDLDTEDESAVAASGDDLEFGLDESEPESDAGENYVFDTMKMDAVPAQPKSDTGEDFSHDTVKMEAVPSEPERGEASFGNDLDLDLSGDNLGTADIDMDSTVEMPKDRLTGGLSLEMDEEDEEDSDKTLFVPRSGDTSEQSLEDELTTKLDLAKAYVELGDSDSARNILQEVMQDGNDNQKRQAEELLNQI